MKAVRSIFLVCLLAATANLQAQIPELIRKPEFRKDAQAAVDSLYNFNVNGAEKRLATWKKKYPDHPLWKLFDAMEVWWIVLSDLKNHSNDKRLLHLMKKANYAASKLLNKQPRHADALIVKAVANGYMARHFANRGEWVTSVQYGRTAIQAYQYLQNVMPGLPDLKLAEGLKLYYAAYLPQAYPVVKTVSWFLPDGNKKKGLKFLKQASRQAVFAGAEATYFLGNIYFNYENRYRTAAHYFRQLYKSYPHNNYYARLFVHSLYQMGRYHSAFMVINKTLHRWNKNDLAFKKILKQELFYWKGRILMRRGQFEKSTEALTKSVQIAQTLSRAKHRMYYTAAAYYAGQVLFYQNKLNKAASYFKVAAESKVGEGYQEMAKKRLEKIRKKS